MGCIEIFQSEECDQIFSIEICLWQQNEGAIVKEWRLEN